MKSELRLSDSLMLPPFCSDDGDRCVTGSLTSLDLFDHEQNMNAHRHGLERLARTLNMAYCTLSRGPDGVGVSELKRRLLISDPDRYGVTIPCKTHVHLLPASSVDSDVF